LAVVEPEMVPLNTDIKNTKILVVEDMELNQLLMKTLLDDFGFECEIAANGKLAVEKLETTAYDIILMDLQMPEMNGFEATKYIRETLKLTIPIIALTADVTTVDVARCKEVGMNDYISKPVDERLLYSKLIGLIKKPILIIDHEVGKPTATDTIRYVDMSYLNKLTQSNTKLIREMITAYLVQTPPLVTMMRKSYISKDWALLKSTVHKMIPSFSIVGISDEYTKMAKKVQVYADALEHAPDLEEIIKSLESVCNHSCVELQNELNAMNDEK
jgi:CheY-like chemotaxis protein